MTRKDFNVLADIIAQTIWSYEDLGSGVRENKGAIDCLLKQNNPNYDPDKFWQAVEENVLVLKGLFRK